MEEVFFSVIIPLFNKEKSISSTIISVLNQTYNNFELIIVNDGSNDNSLEIAKSFKDKRLKILEQTNGGVSKARNTGIKAARYKYIIPLDADDLFLPGALDEFVYLIQNFQKGNVFATIGETDRRKIPSKFNRYYVKDHFLSSAILMAKYNAELMMTGIVVINRKCFDVCGFYNENITHGEDIDLWNRLKDQCKIVKSEVVTMIYRLNVENRATDIIESEKIFPQYKSIDKKKVTNTSQQLYIGVKLFVKLFFEIRNSKGQIKWSEFQPYTLWILRAVWLYSKYRIFKYNKQ